MEVILNEFKDFIEKMSTGGIKRNIRREMTTDIIKKWNSLSNSERVFISKNITWTDYNKYKNYIKFLNLDRLYLKYPIKIENEYYGIGTAIVSSYIAENKTFEESIIIYPCNDGWEGILDKESFELWIEGLRPTLIELGEKSKYISNFYEQLTFRCPNRVMETLALSVFTKEDNDENIINAYKDIIKGLSEILV